MSCRYPNNRREGGAGSAAFGRPRNFVTERAIAIAIAICLFVTTIMVQDYVIPTGSMVPHAEVL
jgi:hypothetical protein